MDEKIHSKRASFSTGSRIPLTGNHVASGAWAVACKGGDAFKTEESHGKSTPISNWSTVNDWPVKGPLPLKEETEKTPLVSARSLRKLKLKR